MICVPLPHQANRGAVPGSSGDEIGKALASVSSNAYYFFIQNF